MGIFRDPSFRALWRNSAMQFFTQQHVFLLQAICMLLRRAKYDALSARLALFTTATDNFLKEYITRTGGVWSTVEILPDAPYVLLFVSYIYSNVNLQDIRVRALIKNPNNKISKCANVKIYIFLHTISCNSEMLRSILIICTKLPNINKSFVKTYMD